MKIISVFLSFLLINSLEFVIGDVTDNASDVIVKCREETGATLDDVQAIVDQKLPTSHAGLCLMACMYESAGIIKDGKLALENLSNLIQGGVENSERVANDCQDVHNDDKCLLVMDILMCISKSVTLKAKEEL